MTPDFIFVIDINEYFLFVKKVGKKCSFGF